MATNDITGDRIRSRPNNKAFDDEFERIFGSKKNDSNTHAQNRESEANASGEGGDNGAVQGQVFNDGGA